MLLRLETLVTSQLTLCNSMYQEVVRERQENVRLVRLMQEKEEMIGKLREEIDLLNRVSIHTVHFNAFVFSCQLDENA